MARLVIRGRVAQLMVDGVEFRDFRFDIMQEAFVAFSRHLGWHSEGDIRCDITLDENYHVATMGFVGINGGEFTSEDGEPYVSRRREAGVITETRQQ